MTNQVITGQVAIPSGYFLKMAKCDYSNHREALAREFFQNSIDAGATEIDVLISSEDREITILDNGCGMSLEVLTDKLLVLGGSHKGMGSVGAFGKAKELLFFSWESYRIQTQKWEVTGQGANYKITELKDPVEGTAISITIQPEEDFKSICYKFRVVAEKIQRGNLKIVINTENVPCDYKRGELVISEDWMELFQDKTSKSNYMQVRIDGIWMFERYLGTDKMGSLIMEVKRSSIECLTSNRDNLKYDYAIKIDKLIQNLVVNSESGLKKNNPRHIKIKGMGKVKITIDKVKEFINKVWGLDIVQKGNMVAEALCAIAPILDKDIVRDRIEENIRSFGSYEALAFIGYQPDFIVRTEKTDEETQRYLNKAKVLKLAKQWTEVLKQVMIDNNYYLDFTAGFTFIDGENASKLNSKEEGLCFFLNPTTLPTDKKALVEDLRMRACHEIAHIDVDGHNEAFVCNMHDVIKRTWKNLPMYKKIVK